MNKHFNSIGLLMLLVNSSLCFGQSVTVAQSQKVQTEPPIEATSLLGKPLRRQIASPEQQARLEKALREAQQRHEHQPENVEHLIWVGRRLAYLWRYQDAIDIYTQGIKRFPDDARLYRHRGHRYITTRQFDKAVADLTRAAQLIEGTKDQVEPDGQPNAAGIPTSTLHTNIYYHLGLAHYLQGDFKAALDAYQKCLAASKNNDMRVATLDWMYMTLRRLKRNREARALLDDIRADMELLENTSYHRRLLMYKGELKPDQLLDVQSGDDRHLDLATYGYGVGHWYLVEGDVPRARDLFQQVIEGSYWAAFGYLAAEAELERMRNNRSEQVDALFRHWSKDTSPGAAVAVVKDGKTLYSNGYGMAHLEHPIPITPQSIFHVASVSKQFTAFAVMLLEQDGKLSLDDDVRTHLPELPSFDQVITLRHLIHHTSGLRDQWELLVLAGWRMDDVITHNDVLDLVTAQRELNFSPGERFLYCNTGYTLLAEVVKRVSGQSLKRFCHQRIFKPLDMQSTHFHDDHRQIVPGRTECYWRRGRGWQKAVLSYAVVGATSLFTTVEDLAKWQRNFETRQVGGDQVFETVFKRGLLNNGRSIDYAGGVYYGQVEKHVSVGHSGGDAGYVCHVTRIPKENLSVIVLANTSSVPAARLAEQIAKIYLEKTPSDKVPTDRVDGPATKTSKRVSRPARIDAQEQPREEQRSIDDYVGRYVSGELQVAYELVADQDQRLRLKRRKYGNSRCRDAGPDAFGVHSGLSLHLQFDRDPKTGQVQSMRVSSGRVKNLRFVKEKGSGAFLDNPEVQ